MLTRSLASAVALLSVGCALPSETNDVGGGQQALTGGLPDVGADAREQDWCSRARESHYGWPLA